MHDARTKNMYAGKLTHMVNKYNNIYHSTIKMKPTNIKASTYIDFNKEKNKKDPKFEVSDYGRISKYKNISAKGYVPNWSEDVFVIKEVRNTVPQTHIVSNLNDKEIVGTFHQKELQKTNQQESKVEKVTNCMSNGKGNIILLIVQLIKKLLLNKISDFLEPYICSKNKLKV